MPAVSQLISRGASYLRGGLNNLYSGIGGKSGGLLTGATSRLQAAGLFGGSNRPSTAGSNVRFGDADKDNDWRVKIRVNPNSKILYWDPAQTGSAGIMFPLRITDGFIFPYTPQITVSHSANYTSMAPTHTNYTQYFYESSNVSSISINGDFTVQTLDEARYFLAAIYFFRACTKMFYGMSQTYQGSPPPIVYLNGYGQHYLPNIPCVVTNFSHTMPQDVDYIEVMTPFSTSTTTTSSSSITPGINGVPGININGTGKNATNAQGGINDQNNTITTTTQTTNTAFNRVPTASTFQITVQPIYSRKQAIDFDYSKFAAGQLITGPNNNYPGGYL